MEPRIKESDPEPEPRKKIDLTDTQIAFSHKSDKELKATAKLFKMMNQHWLVNLGSSMSLLAVKMRLPFFETIVKSTVFYQFCGGENLLDCQAAIDKLYQHDTLTILDYGAEGKTTEKEIEAVVEESIKALELAASNDSVPVISCKITAFVDNDILIKVQEKKELSDAEESSMEKLYDRISSICSRAHELGVGVFIDAEESWLQEPIDELVIEMMEKYNKEKVAVYNTYQLYRHDKLAQLKEDHKRAVDGGYILGAKLVRGAYMEKERARAEEEGYPSPIQQDKESTDRDFDLAIDYVVRNYESIASCCASHNAASNLKQAELIEKLDIDPKHPHLNFCQLYGMSDFITYNISSQGYNVAKYVPYGPVKEVIPYLIRRAQENTSVTGEMSRELNFIMKEIKRRGI